jgi:RNA polymerase sigma-70 factor (ECF subfamily)
VSTGPARPDPRSARYESLFDTVYEPLQRYVRRRCAPGAADDVVAEVLLVLWRRLDDVPDDAPLPWAYGVARRCLANERRGGRRRLALVGRLESTAAADVAPAADEFAERTDPALADVLRALPPDDREVVRLWAWEQLAPREIAVVLDISPNAASIRLHRAKARLAQSLGLGKDTPTAGHTLSGSTEEAP